MNGGAGNPSDAIPWAHVLCSCGRADVCVCGGKKDRIVGIREEVSAQFLAHRIDVYRYLPDFGLSPNEAEDATQESFLRLYRSRLQGQSINSTSILAWVLKVARGIAIDRLRRRRREQRLFEALSPNVAETLPDTRHESREVEQVIRDHRAAFIAAVQRLNAIERQCLHLRASGQSLQTVGGVVGLPVWAVSRVIRRAIRTLRKHVDGLA